MTNLHFLGRNGPFVLIDTWPDSAWPKNKQHSGRQTS
jgi:hypothetical protein